MMKITCFSLVLALAAGVAGTGYATAQTTPVQGEIAQTSVAPSADMDSMPKWSEFPAPPTSVPTAADVRVQVDSTEAKRRQLKTEVRALVWDESDPKAYAAAAQGRIDPEYAKQIGPASSVAEINALAAELRRRAAPPPVAD